MSKVFVLIAILLFASLRAAGQERKVYEHDYLVKVGDLAPDFPICEVDGKSYRLSDLRGKVVMLQFTASWCSVCLAEMPHIEKEIWQAKKDAGLVVLGIDRDEPKETVVRFRQKSGVTYPLALDPGAEIFARFATKEAGVTRNVIIDKKGRIVFLTRLFKQEEFEQMKQVIQSELATK